MSRNRATDRRRASTVAKTNCSTYSTAELPPTPTQQDIDKLMAAAPRYGIEFCPDAKPIPDTSAPAADRSYWVLGQFVTLKLTGRGTAGNFSVAEVICNPSTGVPLHLHRAMEEVFYVVEGTIEFTFGDRVEQVEAGSLVFVPRGMMHGLRNTGRSPACLFDVHIPAGFETFFEEAGIPATDPTVPPDMDRVFALIQKHGMEMAMP